MHLKLVFYIHVDMSLCVNCFLCKLEFNILLWNEYLIDMQSGFSCLEKDLTIKRMMKGIIKSIHDWLSDLKQYAPWINFHQNATKFYYRKISLIRTVIVYF